MSDREVGKFLQLLDNIVPSISIVKEIISSLIISTSSNYQPLIAHSPHSELEEDEGRGGVGGGGGGGEI